MPSLQPVFLRFPQGLRVGGHSANLEESGLHLPSDTLFSALVDSWSRNGGDPAAWMGPFLDGGPPFLLTSAFPFAGELRFYPVPVDLGRLMPVHRSEDSGLINKRLKRIRFLSEGLLRLLLAGQSMPDLLTGAHGKADGVCTVPLQDGALCLLPEEMDRLPETMRMNGQGGTRAVSLLNRQHVWRQERVPRVAVDRVNSASNVFHAGRTRFASGCGLWFGVQWRDADLVVEGGTGLSYGRALRARVAALGDGGVGAERSAGYGAFDATWGEEFALREPAPGRPAWLLSRYLPSKAELPHCLNDGEAAYNLERIGGWARSLGGADRRRKQIYFVAEGSLIAWPASATVGKIVDLRPEETGDSGSIPHPVWRCGMALAAGLEDVQEGADDHLYDL